MKTCSVCKVEKTLDEYHSFKRKNGKSAKHSRCIECSRKQSKDYYYANKEIMLARTKTYYLEIKHGLGVGGYDALLIKQNGKCAICKSTDPGAGYKYFSVDHDHACCSSKHGCKECVRGLLCVNCNNGLGRFKDNPENLRRAADYIEQK